MSDPTWTTTSQVVDALIKLDDTWVRVSAIEAVRPSKAYGPPTSNILLASGDSIYVHISVDDVIDLVKKANVPPTRTFRAP